ncbi:type I-G CRISPR-associated protein Cas7 [Sorangium sp. So ce128]|uniref:type I-G CRISPR-associated protein Cas7 n=1 Tax=Sorangium sp. So ce128 TaxID=3133281 RepID=UPI003F624294
MKAALEPNALLESGAHRLVLRATLTPVAGLDRFQPAGFPEIGHVIYDAPRSDGRTEKVCIIDSAPSMANHLETVCLNGPHDPSLSPALAKLPYLRCVTGTNPKNASTHELVVTSFTEGHRLASSYFLEGFRLERGDKVERRFAEELHERFGLRKVAKKSHLLPDGWWNVFETVFQYDPNSLVHGIFFPKWQIRIPRLLTAVHEAFGAMRVATSGVKFDRLGKSTSGQPIFAKDEETAAAIRATFVLDLGLARSFGREARGLNDKQKALLIALALWKIGALLRAPFRYRSGCDLECKEIEMELGSAKKMTLAPDGLSIEIGKYIKDARFKNGITDVFWPQTELFTEAVKDEGEQDAGEVEEDEASE